jgi:hypothetical protein
MTATLRVAISMALAVGLAALPDKASLVSAEQPQAAVPDDLRELEGLSGSVKVTAAY